LNLFRHSGTRKQAFGQGDGLSRVLGGSVDGEARKVLEEGGFEVGQDGWLYIVRGGPKFKNFDRAAAEVVFLNKLAGARSKT
jgi:hypothetical protein